MGLGKGWGNFPGGAVFPRLVPPVVIAVSVAVVVTLGESVGDVLGADHAVAVRLADLDALVGECGFEVGGTPAFVGGGLSSASRVRTTWVRTRRSERST